MAHSSEDIRERAYRLWEIEGKPANEHVRRWENALSLLAEEARLAASIGKLTEDPSYTRRIAALLEAGLKTIPRVSKPAVIPPVVLAPVPPHPVERTMKKEHRYLVSYIIDNQPSSTEITTHDDPLAPEQAREHLKALHGVSAELTDIRVTPILHPKDKGTTPGHYQQP